MLEVGAALINSGGPRNPSHAIVGVLHGIRITHGTRGPLRRHVAGRPPSRRDSGLTLDRRSPEPRIRPQRPRVAARGVKGYANAPTAPLGPQSLSVSRGSDGSRVRLTDAGVTTVSRAWRPTPSHADRTRPGNSWRARDEPAVNGPPVSRGTSGGDRGRSVTLHPA